MRIAIHDANILIDFILIDLLTSLFELGIEMHTTDFVLGEIEGDQVEQLEPYINSGNLGVIAFGATRVVEIQILTQRFRGLSFEDCSVLLAAREAEAILLTGDGRLRKVAEGESIEVHGDLWLFDLLVEKNLLTKKDAGELLGKLMTINSRLPKSECDKRLKKWV